MTNIDDVWKNYKKNRDDKSKEVLVKNYLPLVKYFTDRISFQLPAEVRRNSREDLYIEGIIGLMEAIDKFELSRNIKFETFASRRVRGAILDSLRKEDLLPKNVRDQAKKIESAYITLESRLGRTATDDEVAAELGVTKEEFYVILDKTRAISLFSFDSELFSKDGEKFKLEDLIGEESSSLIEFEKKEAVEKLAAIIETFEKEERIILETYYWDGLNFREIGKVLDISESRVCQIHTKLILKLRSSFKKLHNER